MKATPARIAEATRLGLENADLIGAACNEYGYPFEWGCAVAQQETNGRHIMGHDVGGALSTALGPVTVAGQTYPQGSDIPITPGVAVAFYILIGAGVKGNGFGVFQPTYANELPDGRSGGFFRQASDEDVDLQDPLQNCRWGIRKLIELTPALGWKAIIRGLGRRVYAAARYNGGPSNPNWTYGREVAARARNFRRAFRALPA